MKRMDGKVALITGASSGIGEALARDCIKRGADVVLVARRKEALEALCKELGDKAHAVQADVTVDGDVERAVAFTLDKLGRLDVVIANAGFGVMGRLDALTLSDWKRQFETNVFGVLRTIYASLDALKKTGGSVAIVGSVAGYMIAPGGSAYSTSKAVIRNLSNSIRHELLPDGVSVTHIAPGFVASNIRMTDNQGVLQQTAKDPVPQWLVMPADVAARQMMNAVLARKAEVIITFHGKVAAVLAGLFPSLISLGYKLASPKPPRALVQQTTASAK